MAGAPLALDLLYCTVSVHLLDASFVVARFLCSETTPPKSQNDN